MIAIFTVQMRRDLENQMRIDFLILELQMRRCCLLSYIFIVIYLFKLLLLFYLTTL